MDYIDLNRFDINQIQPKHKICDIVLGGGGFRSYYHLGFFKILKELIKQNKIQPRHFIGTSSGAISAVYHVCGVTDDSILLTYQIIREQMELGKSLHDAAIYTLRQILPPNAHLICSGKVRIYVSVLGWFGFYPMYINHFETFEDLILALSASINIPWFTTYSWFGTVLKHASLSKRDGTVIKHACLSFGEGTIIKESRCYDGLFTSIVPSIRSEIHDIPQLEISTHKVLYPKRHTLHPGDNHIYLLSLRGLIESFEFFNGQKNNIIKWIEPEKKLKNTKLYLIIPGLMWIWAINF